jgi:hypothetical protein
MLQLGERRLNFVQSELTAPPSNRLDLTIAFKRALSLSSFQILIFHGSHTFQAPNVAIRERQFILCVALLIPNC